MSLIAKAFEKIGQGRGLEADLERLPLVEPCRMRKDQRALQQEKGGDGGVPGAWPGKDSFGPDETTVYEIAELERSRLALNGGIPQHSRPRQSAFMAMME